MTVLLLDSKIGKGSPILLLHTFRNRLEYSDKLGKLLENKFTVYSIDLPGFGDSPINTSTNYNLDFFTKSIVSFIKKITNEKLNYRWRIYWCNVSSKCISRTS